MKKEMMVKHGSTSMIKEFPENYQVTFSFPLHCSCYFSIILQKISRHPLTRALFMLIWCINTVRTIESERSFFFEKNYQFIIDFYLEVNGLFSQKRQEAILSFSKKFIFCNENLCHPTCYYLQMHV